jgi:hypothetical protein
MTPEKHLRKSFPRRSRKPWPRLAGSCSTPHPPSRSID